MKKILIIEDDINLGTTLTGALEMQEYKVEYLSNAVNALDLFGKFQPDIVILDVMLNDLLDGFEIGRLIREISNVPILFTTSRDGNDDLKTGLGMINSDYIRKPYRLMEVTLRIDNLLKRFSSTQLKSETIQIGQFSFFLDERALKYECDKIQLNNYETAVLSLLCNNKNTFISREQIIKTVWNEENTKIKQGSLNNTLTRLRKYLSRDTRIELESRINFGVMLKINA